MRNKVLIYASIAITLSGCTSVEPEQSMAPLKRMTEGYCDSNGFGAPTKIAMKITVKNTSPLTADLINETQPIEGKNIIVKSVCPKDGGAVGPFTQINFTIEKESGVTANCVFKENHGNHSCVNTNMPFLISELGNAPLPYESSPGNCLQPNDRIFQINQVLGNGKRARIRDVNRKGETASISYDDYEYTFEIQCDGNKIEVDPTIRNRSRY